MSGPKRALKWILAGGGIIVGLVVALAISLLLLRPYWDMKGNFMPNFDFESREAKDRRLEEDRKAQAAAKAEDAATSATAEISAPAPAPIDDGASWTAFRGPRRDGKSDETGLLESWPDAGPPELYRQPVGAGFAGFAIGGGRAFTIEQRRDDEAVVAYDFASGRELWVRAYPAFFAEQMGGDGPRATPTLEGNRLYSLGATGQLLCLDAATGEKLWEANILEGEGAANLEWGMAGAPLVDGERVLVTGSGTAGPSVFAFEKSSGKLLWKTLPERQGYCSLVIEELAGRRQLLNFAASGLNSLDAETGEPLWNFPWATQNGINISQPIAVGGDRVFISSGYGKGCALLQIEAADGKLSARELWSNKNMKNKFNSSVLHEGYLYGLDEGVFACIEVETGKRAWKGGRYGHGQILFAEGKIIVLAEDGRLALVRATPEKHEEISAFKALSGKTWNVPALAGGRLLVRNSSEMACYDLRKK